MEPEREDLEIKRCFVMLQKIEIDTYDGKSSDSDDLPILPFVMSTRKKKISKKSSADLLKEHQSLIQNIKNDNESSIHIEETIRRLEIVETIEDVSYSTPDDIPLSEEKNDIKIFCEKQAVLFFNSRDVTPDQCGYNNRCHESYPVLTFEQKMISFKRVEFEHVISSFLYAADECCISELKSFVTFLLRTLSVHSDISCIIHCYKTLVSILDNHDDSPFLTFGSAEIFMLLFNYGVDIDSFKFLSKMKDIKENLEFPQYPLKNSSGIPNTWHYNLKFILKSITKIVSSCIIEETDMERIIIFLMWMSKDSILLKENINATLKDCIYACLENIKEQNWNTIVCNISNTVLSIEENLVQKFATVYELMDSLPSKNRGIELRKIISFHSLKCIVFGSSDDLEESSLDFQINDLFPLVKQLIEIDIELLSFALKFFDNSVKQLNASKEDYTELCNLLKQSEISLSSKAQDEKTHFLKISSKLRIFCGQKAVYNLLKIKSETDYNQETSDEQNSVTPAFSENSDSCSHSDYTNSSSSDVNIYNNVQIKSEQDQSHFPETMEKSSSLKMLIRKKRSSRSSSGNSLVSSNLILRNLKCEIDDLSRQSSEFECHLLDNESEVRSVAVDDSTIDVEYPESNLILSDFTVEYPEEISDVLKVKHEPIIQMPTSSEVEKMITVDNEDQLNESPPVPGNFTNQNLVEDLSPLPEICEVKSIAFCDMDIDNSSGQVSELNNEISCSEANSMLSNCETPVLCSTSEPEVAAYEGSALKNASSNQKNNNLLDSEDDVVFIKETISPKRLPQINIEENIPSPIQRYTKALPELSITPVKSVPSLSVECTNNLVDCDDILIIEEKTPVKDNDNEIIFLEKILNPSQGKSSFPPKDKARDRDNVSTHVNIESNVEASKSLKSQETNSDGDEIILLSIIANDKNISNENESSRVTVNHTVSLSNESFPNISYLQSESPSHQCREMLNSVINQVEINKKCKEVLESALELVTSLEKDPFYLFEDHADVTQTTLNSCDIVDSFNKYLVSDDMSSLSTEKPTSDLENEISPTVDLLEDSIIEESNLEMCQKSPDEPNEDAAVFQTASSNAENLANKTFNDESLASTSGHLKVADISNKNQMLNAYNDKNKESGIEIDVSDLIHKICDTVENITGDMLNPSLQNSSYDLHDDDNVISQINNRLLETVENNLKSSISPVTINTLESDIGNQIDNSESVSKITLISESGISDIDATKNHKLSEVISINNKSCKVVVTSHSNVPETNVSRSVITKSILKQSNSKTLDKSATECLNKLPVITPVAKAKAKICTVPQLNSSNKSVLHNKKNSRHFDSCKKKLKIPFQSNILSASNQKATFKSNNTKILLDSLINSNQKRIGAPIGNVAKKSVPSKHEVEHNKNTQKIFFHKKNTSCSVSPSSRIQKKRSWSSISENREDLMGNSPRKTPRKYSPLKSSLSAKYNQKSPKKFFDYSVMKQKYKHFNKASLLSRTGLNLTNVLREQIASSSVCNINNNNESDDDVIELYVDPKRYADKECLIVYESEEIVILDSD